MTTVTYMEFETRLLDKMPNEPLRRIVMHAAQRVWDDMRIEHGMPPLFNPMTVFDDPNYVPPTDKECATKDDALLMEDLFE